MRVMSEEEIVKVIKSNIVHFILTKIKWTMLLAAWGWKTLDDLLIEN